MPLFEALRLALQTIRTQKLKSGFSAIGVFIGVTFLIGAWSIVNGMNRYMTEKFAGTLIGVNTFHLRHRLRRPGFGLAGVAAPAAHQVRRRGRGDPAAQYARGDRVVFGGPGQRRVQR